MLFLSERTSNMPNIWFKVATICMPSHCLQMSLKVSYFYYKMGRRVLANGWSPIDKAPRLSIRRVIWILASDTVFVFVKLNQHLQILKRQCCLVTQRQGCRWRRWWPSRRLHRSQRPRLRSGRRKVFFVKELEVATLIFSATDLGIIWLRRSSLFFISMSSFAMLSCAFRYILHFLF